MKKCENRVESIKLSIIIMNYYNTEHTSVGIAAFNSLRFCLVGQRFIFSLPADVAATASVYSQLAD